MNSNISPNFKIEDLKKPDQISELIHRIAHEIGNPLTAIIAISSLLPYEKEEERIAGHSKSISQEAWKINALNEKLVILLSDKSGNPEPCNVTQCFNDAAAKLKSRYNVIDLNLRINAQSEDLEVLADEEQFVILLMELLLNAHLYSSNSVINCTISKEESTLISISNICEQKSEIDLKDAFRPLVSGQKTENRLGLGLTLAYAIAKRFNGEISISEEEAPNGVLFSAKLKF